MRRACCCVDLASVDLARRVEGAMDGRLGDLVEGDAERLLVREVQGAAEVPRDRLALAVEVGRHVDALGALGDLAELGQGLAPAADGHVLGLEAVLDVDAELLRGQVPHVPHGRLHDEVAPQVPVDRASLRGALDDDDGLGPAPRLAGGLGLLTGLLRALRAGLGGGLLLGLGLGHHGETGGGDTGATRRGSRFRH
jgi:hypothetical protein